MRSKLFVPASRPELYTKAMQSEADGISFDLEDAVEQRRKATARVELATWLKSLPPKQEVGKILIVRCNSIDTPEFQDDIQAVACAALHQINLPKVESPDAVIAMAEALERAEKEHGVDTPIGILANIESPRGLRCASEIARAHPRVCGLQIGFGDLFKPLGIQPSNEACQYVRIQVRLAAGEAGIEAYDGAYVDIGNPQGYEEDAKAANAMGFAGKSCIHPSQVRLANNIFIPDAAEVAHALRVMEAAENNLARGTGAFVVDGKLVDGPFIESARRLIERARRADTLE
ncbi:HpcH/HpaI aldolase/citrate lyase family protein [Allopusillimonas ginsengisoli]|uniref:HpcH/HpaI aldolase/citrate lyase family protein n=1 Tax=Allopusillimonas ginsengisoli TaxID=453575 RepID=UPI001021AC62|nr:CoA ester lyase [Allopusillimonas ginsengisoli]TEA79991.1 CoA ester lyase [Allopusillimonas ginsengisoli]